MTGNDDTISSIVERSAKAWPHKTCIVDGPIRMSYKDFDEFSNSIAASLLGLGIQKGDAVAIQLPNWCEFLLAFLASAKIGAVASLVPVTYRANEIERTLALTRPRVVVVPRSFRGFDCPAMYRSFDQHVETVRLAVVDRDARPDAGPLERFEIPPCAGISREAPGGGKVAPDDAAVVFFTSGTEGEPKAAVHSHRTLLHTIRPLVDVMELTARDISLAVAPLSTPAGLAASSLAILSQGGAVVLQERFEAQEALRLISTERVTLLAGTPAHLEYLLGLPDIASYDLGSLRLVRLTGAFAPPKLVRLINQRIGCRVAVGYGMTEVGTITMTAPDDPLEVVCNTAGRPLPGMEVGIFDERGESLGVGKTGRIAASGPSTFPGYLAEDGRIREATDSDGWLFTGDLGFIDSDGNLHFVGRDKEIVNRGGIKISPVEVEKLLLEHPNVESAAVVGMPDDQLGERSCAYVVTRSGQTVSLEEITDFLRQKGIATFKLPERLEVVAALPLTRNLKVMKEALRRDIAQKIETERRADRSLEAKYGSGIYE